MISQERIILMTKLAAYEEHEGRRNMETANYFRSDYIGLQVIRSVIGATIAYGVMFALYIYYDFEIFMADLYKMDLLGFGKSVLTYYAEFVIVYSVISYILYSYKYHKAKKNLKTYQNSLKQLAAMYDIESR
ncbi:MAG TPA: hypothetical protein DCG85_08615 [Lachnospiraceae bacterium]|jgi:hypothetical protein|nr:hypothetical protein [Lachnospiraceae bacterium]